MNDEPLGNSDPLPSNRVETFSENDTKTSHSSRELGSSQSADRIAIVGMACRFPGAPDLQSFWHQLMAGTNCVSECPPGMRGGRVGELYEDTTAIPSACRYGAFLTDIDQFDADFFRISPPEAEFLDPQQRMMLETSWRALENANIDPETLRGSSASVYAGMSNNDYRYLILGGADTSQPASSLYTITGTSLNTAIGRVSYALGFEGPAMTVDTACSSSLVAMHEAASALRTGESDIALAGGVQLVLSGKLTELRANAGMLSPDGTCKTFDAAANGYVRGEGCGIVVMKRLADAERDGDPIWAVVAATAINQDGTSDGLTVPRGSAQRAVIEAALENAGIQATDVDYLEAHGTGTPVGDPIEINAAAEVYGKERDADRPLLIGSVKTNFGHLEPAAGVAGVIKTALAMKFGVIPKHLNFSNPSPEIEWDRLPVQVTDQATPWPEKSISTRFAGINSFGFSGTNAHVLLQGYGDHVEAEGTQQDLERIAGEPKSVSSAFDSLTPTEIDASNLKRSQRILPLSAKSPEALVELAGSYSDWCSNQQLSVDEGSRSSKEVISDFAWTVSVARSHFNHRRALVIDGEQSQLEQLTAIDAVEPRSTPQKIAFAYTGQGSQWAGMGKALYESERVFRQVIDRCEEVIQQERGESLIDRMFGLNDTLADLEDPAWVQPCIYALECGLTDIWRSLGVEPHVVFGHSLGEIAAARTAGVFSLEDGCRYASGRGRLMSQLPGPGLMAAIFLTEDEIKQEVEDHNNTLDSVGISVAAMNGGHQVVSGYEHDVEPLLQRLEEREVRVRRLPKSPAYHSALVEPILDDLAEIVANLEVNAPQLQLVSNLTGELVSEDMRLDGAYWQQHARQGVAYRRGVETIESLGVDAVLEIGPNAVLGAMTQMSWPESSAQLPTVLASLRMPRENHPEIPADGGFLHSVAEAYEQGLDISFESLYAGETRQKIAVPGYPFQRRRFWVETRRRRVSSTDHELLGSRHETPYGDVMYTTEFTPSDPKWLNEHKVFGQVLVPGAVFGSMGIASLDSAAGACVDDLQLHNPLVFKSSDVDQEEAARQIQLVLKTEDDSETRSFEVHSKGADDEKWVLHASGQVGTQTGSDVDSENVDVNDLISSLESRDVGDYYKQKASTNIQLGTPFRNIKKLWSGHGEAIAEIAIREDDVLQGVDLQPLLLDACFQVLSAARETTDVGEGATYIPFGWERLTLASPCTTKVICRAQMHDMTDEGAAARGETPEALSGDLWLFDSGGRKLGELFGLTVKRATRSSLMSAIEDPKDLIYETVWRQDDHPSLVRQAHPLPSLEDLQENVEPFFSYLEAQGVKPEDRYALLLDLEQLAHAWIVSAFDQAGIERRQGGELHADELIAQMGILPTHQRLVERILRMMNEAGILSKLDDYGYEVVLGSDQPLPDGLGDPEELLDALQNKHPHGLYELTLLSRFGRNLMDLLTGEADPLALLFDEDSAGAADFYKTAPVSVAGNRMLGDVISRLIRDLPDDRLLRVIEVGAGTGATTEIVFAELASTRLEYTYTDISAGFFSEAERNFEGNGIDIDYRPLDIEDDPLAQGYEHGHYDIVIAANVLHATRNLQETLSHCGQLLAPNGVLIALESLRGRAWQDLTFGFLDGWWRFNDQYRTDHALASPEIWHNALADAGFTASHVFGDETVSETSGPLGSGTVVGQLDEAIHLRPATWVVEPDEADAALRLIEFLRDRNQHVLITQFASADPSKVSVPDAIGHEELTEKLASLPDDAPLRGVIHLAGLDGHGVEATTQEMKSDVERGVASAMSLTQILIESGVTPSNGVWYVTQGAQVLEHERTGQLAGSALWGFGKVVELESSLLTPHMVDLDPESDSMDALIADILAPDQESHIAYRQGTRYIARLVREAGIKSIELPEEPNWVIASGQDGSLQNVRAANLERFELEPRQVRVQVEATGLNFSDVLVALGAQVPNASLGLEFAGVISDLGTDVQEFTLGQRVLGMGFGTFGPEITTHADLVAAAPDDMTFHELATIPIVFATAAISYELANIKAGDRVLIHSASGGVGIAAIQLAQEAGAEIYATASQPKHKFLRSIGIEHIYDSRSLDFGAEILADTQDKGVDIVLNSLTGEGFIETSLSCLAKDGCFLEIGRLNILTPEEMAETRPDVSYFIVSLDELKRDHPEQVGVAFRALMKRFKSGGLSALRHAKWPMLELADALQYMGSARHVGKLVLTMPALARGSLSTNRTYLITGGFGGIGCAVANWLAERGAKHIVLNGRRDPDDEAITTVDALREQGVNVELKIADVTDISQLDAMMTEIDSAMPPLGGIVHSVGVLSDGALTNLTWDRFETVLWPKILGAWRLHELTKHMDLDLFVLFSSATGVLGNAGQANHAAANAFLDQLAAHRRSLGLAGQSIAWGAWSEIGEAAEQRERIASQLETTGTGWISPELGIRTLDYLISQDLRNPAAMSVDWAVLEQHLNTRPMFLDDMFLTDDDDASSESDALNLDVFELRDMSSEQRIETLMLYIQNQLQSILRLPSLPSVSVGFFDLGMDSLMAVELRNRLIRAFKDELTISRTVVFDFPNVEALASHFALELDQEASTDSAAQIDAPANTSITADSKVAVIGMACRFPSASGYEEFWQNLERGEDAIQPNRNGEAQWQGVVGDEGAKDDYIRCGGFVSDIDQFDAKFFGIRPIEARAMDPRQRLLLETCWETLENAAIDPSSLRGARVGVYVGLGSSEYRDLVNANGIDDSYLGTSSSMTTGRISYVFGLTGPAMSFDLACASSLVAIHEGLKALRTGEVDLALVGGANAILSPAIMRFHRELGLLSTDGRCIPFAEDASGYIRGEGCGMLLLQRYADAEKEGNPIWSTVVGSAVNQSGASAGLTIPNGSAQEQVMRDAVQRAGIDPNQVDFVEAHATGLALSDPIEIRAMSSVYTATAAREKPLLVGSVKGSIGHLEWAAGVAGAIKVILSMVRQTIPAQLHLDTPNQQVDWADLDIDISQSLTDWSSPDRNPMGAVSAFGMSGTNAHVILEGTESTCTTSTSKLALPVACGKPVKVLLEPSQTTEDFDLSIVSSDLPQRRCHFLPLSGKCPEAVANLARKYERWLQQLNIDNLDESATNEFLADFAWSASIGRSHMNYRQGVVFSDLKSLFDGLTRVADEPAEIAEVDSSMPSNSAFLIMGDMSDWLEFGKALYATDPFIKVIIDHCNDVYTQSGYDDLIEGLLNCDSSMVQANPEPEFQSATVAVQTAVAAFFQSLGIHPKVAAGTNTGLLVASYLAGASSLATTLSISHEMATEPKQGVVSSESSELKFPVADANTGTVAESSGALRELFETMDVGDHPPSAEVFEILSDQGVSSVVEISPTSYQQLNENSSTGDGLTRISLGCNPHAEAGPHHALASAVKMAYQAGMPVAFQSCFSGESRRKITLPSYAFERKRFWFNE